MRFILLFINIRRYIVIVSLLFGSNAFAGLLDSSTREQWVANGWTWEAAYIADYFSVVDGGLKRDSEYLGNMDITLEVDSEKALSWPNGRFFFYVLANHGGSPSENIGDIQAISNIDAPDTTKLYEAWYEHRFLEARLSAKFGLYDVNSEFDTTDTGGLFILSAHGIGTEYAGSGQNGPSIFPTTSVALRLFYQPTESSYIQTAVMDGVPGDPDDSKGTHIQFHDDDGLLWVAEAGLLGHGSSWLKKAAIGGWYYSEESNEDASGNAIRARNNHGIYALAEGRVYSEVADREQGLDMFIRYGVADRRINQIGSYFGLGVNYTGLIPGRNKDVFGLAVASARTSDDYLDAQRAFNIDPTDHETIVELTYQMQITDWLTAQPDIQWIKNPGMDKTIEDATVFGVRVEISL